MILVVNQQLCAGCGVCMETCSVGAIQLVEHIAVIDAALCTQCEACINACPSEAITALSIPAPSIPIAAMPVVESQIVPVQREVALPKTATLTHSIVQLTGAALVYLGREAAPRLVDVLVTALERRLERPITTAVATLPDTSRAPIAQGRGKRRQARYRGRRSEKRIHLERR